MFGMSGVMPAMSGMLNTGPSFLSRLGSMAPQMMNSFAQNYGDEQSRGTARQSSSLFNRPMQSGNQLGRAKPKSGINTGPTQLPMNPPPPMPPPMSPPVDIMGGMNPGMGGMGFGSRGNTGIGGGLWNRFNRFSNL
jgi:hypothetical protein